MNSRHVYIGNHYSFTTPSSKYRASAMGGFLMFFMTFSLEDIIVDIDGYEVLVVMNCYGIVS
jgi:hypothetical protein